MKRLVYFAVNLPLSAPYTYNPMYYTPTVGIMFSIFCKRTPWHSPFLLYCIKTFFKAFVALGAAFIIAVLTEVSI